jgi:hypothetical protein
MLKVGVRSTSIVLAIQCGFNDPGDSASFDCELKQVATHASQRSLKTQIESVCHLPQTYKIEESFFCSFVTKKYL